MNIDHNACPTCGKRAGLRPVGPDFKHLVEQEYEEEVVEKRKVLDDGVESVVNVRFIRKSKRLILKKGPGSFCKLCGWSKRDTMSVHYKASCKDCGTDLGTQSRLEDVKQKWHRCATCSKKRVERGEQDPDDLVTFQLLCAGGCGKPQSFLSWPEGALDGPPAYAYRTYFCPDEKCAEVRRKMAEEDRLASEAAGKVQ